MSEPISVVGLVEQLIQDALRELFQNKHLYQSVRVPSDFIPQRVKDTAIEFDKRIALHWDGDSPAPRTADEQIVKADGFVQGGNGVTRGERGHVSIIDN